MKEEYRQSLIEAITKGDIKKLQKQLRKLPDINTPLEKGKCLLHYAAEKTFDHTAIAVFDYLLALPTIQVDIKDDNSETPLLLAATNHNTIGMCRLIEHGSDYNVKNKDGTPLLDLLISEAHVYDSVASLIRQKKKEKQIVSDLSAASSPSTSSTLTLRKQANSASQRQPSPVELTRPSISSTKSGYKHWFSNITNFFQSTSKQRDKDAEQATLIEFKQQ